MKLVDKQGNAAVIGQTYQCFRGERMVLTDYTIPHKASSTGRVYVKLEGTEFERSYYPSVIGLQFVD